MVLFCFILKIEEVQLWIQDKIYVSGMHGMRGMRTVMSVLSSLNRNIWSWLYCCTSHFILILFPLHYFSSRSFAYVFWFIELLFSLQSPTQRIEQTFLPFLNVLKGSSLKLQIKFMFRFVRSLEKILRRRNHLLFDNFAVIPN